MVMMIVVTEAEWGTWEELLLAGAVLRHGSSDWDVVSGELRSRSLFPENFTPQICKNKYEDLRRRYSGCKVWFEELKKKRMAELKAALQESEDSIGSLESKLQNLKAERDDECPNDCDSSRTVSAEPCRKSKGAEDTSKDLSSTGSFTQQAQRRTDWSPETKLETPVIERDRNSHVEKVVETVYGGQVLPSMRKRRGKRKRKDCSKDVKEPSDLLDSSADLANVSRCRETSAVDSGRTGGSDGPSSRTRGHEVLVTDELTRIYDAIAQNECASVFSRRLDSQKRGRYKKLVRRHMDIDTIRSRIGDRSITSAKELFRDLLLVASNASLFYSRSTREHKSAVCLRDIVTESLKRYLTEDGRTATKPEISVAPSPARKPRTSQPPNKTRLGGTEPVPQDVIKTASGGKRTFGTDTPPSVKLSAAAKKGASAAAATATRRKLECKQTKHLMDSNASAVRKRGRVR